MQERNKAVPSVYIILIRGEKILFGKRINTGYYDGYYGLPAGHVEADELPLEALVREINEEIGLSILPENAKLVHTMFRAKHDETGQRVDFFLRWKNGRVNRSIRSHINVKN